MRALFELTKPKITRLVLIATAAGFYLGARGRIDVLLFVHALIGTALVASGTNALNQWWERDVDGLMQRTRSRPLPSGRLRPGMALGFGCAMVVVGSLYLAALVNGLTALLAAFTATSYVFLYTPLKRRTWHATLVGAVPGALPIMGGWTAAGGALVPAAWVLFGILFLWQIPHFLALAWMYREDYQRGGFVTLSGLDPTGKLTGTHSAAYALLLVPVSALPTLIGLTGTVYLVSALILGAGFAAYGTRLALRPSTAGARRLFLASVAYLPVLLLLMVLDKAPV
jgi:protoheme IX farnesyltransferase